MLEKGNPQPGKDRESSAWGHESGSISAADLPVRPLGDLRSPVFPGDIFARIIAGKDGTPGRDLVSIGEGCDISEDGHGIRAEIYGLANISEEQVSVEELLKVDDDLMKAHGRLYPFTFEGDRVTTEKIGKMLEFLEFSGALNSGEIEEALTRARETGEPEDVMLMSGVPPVNGSDGKLELEFKTKQEVGTVLEDGSIDFHERDTVHSVKEGDLVGKIIPPGDGTVGKDLFGDEVPCEMGRPVNVTPGENIHYSEDTGELLAVCDGMVMSSRGRLSITDLYWVKGDVDLASGNIRGKTGSVIVTGTVRSGFEVESTGNLIVRESIECANVKSQGDIEVKRGILMQKKCRVKAGGNISALFAQNARLEAGGDIRISRDITNCEVTAVGSINVSERKGRVQGGTLRCGIGIEAYEIGSRLETPTTVIIGPVEMDGDVNEKGHGGRADATKSPADGTIKVRNTIHPGVIIVMYGCRMEVKTPINFGWLFYDPETNSIRIVPL